MYLRCPRCRTHVGVEAVGRENQAQCPLCGAVFQPGAGSLGACRRDAAAVRHRERARPLDAAASLLLFGASAAVLFRAVCGPASQDPLSGPGFWLLTGWVPVLVLVAWLGYRTDRDGSFPAARATAVTLLLALLAPVLYTLLPVGRMDAALAAVSAAVTQPGRHGGGPASR